MKRNVEGEAGSRNGLNESRRTLLKGAALVGAVGAPALMASTRTPAAPQEASEDPKAPPGLGPHAMLDARFPITYEASVPAAVRVIAQYFSALSRRDLKGMSDALHFPFGTYEGTQGVVVETAQDLIAHAPPSMNMSENPERFTDHDGYLKPGAYDVFSGLEVINSDPVRVNISLLYNRFDNTGKKLLRCEGIYCVTNNDGKWAIQIMSTIFTPAEMVGVTYGDTIEAAKRLRINHDLAYVVNDERAVWTGVRQLGRNLGVTGASYTDAPDGKAMEHFRVKGIKNRLTVSDVTPESLAKDHTDFDAYRALFKKTGLGNWGFVYGSPSFTRVIHATVDKAHALLGVTRFTVAGEEVSSNVDLAVVTYEKGRWGMSGGFSYICPHDRANDVRV